MSSKVSEHKIGKTKSVEPQKPLTELEELQMKLRELQQKEVEDIAKEIDAIAEAKKVSIGIQMTAQKLAEIMAYMIQNNKQTISLKFEVWKT